MIIYLKKDETNNRYIVRIHVCNKAPTFNLLIGVNAVDDNPELRKLISSIQSRPKACCTECGVETKEITDNEYKRIYDYGAIEKIA